MTFIKINNLKAGYDHKAILKDLNFSINKGEFLGIVGPNGAGKSTLVKTLSSQLKPLEGSIEYAKKTFSCGYLAQNNLDYSDFPASVFEVVSSGCLNSLGFRPFLNKQEKNKVLEILNLLEISKLKNECYRNLSGGQKRTVLLGRALCAALDLLILDEPNAGLDVNASERFYKILNKAHSQLNLTIIMITHDFEVLKNCSLVLHLDHGQKFFGPIYEYVNTEICQQFWGKR